MHANVECVCFLFCGFDYHQETVKNFKNLKFFISKNFMNFFDTDIFSDTITIFMLQTVFICVYVIECV